MSQTLAPPDAPLAPLPVVREPLLLRTGRRLRPRGGTLVAWPTFVILALLVVPPLWATVRLSFGTSTPLGGVEGFTLHNYVDVWHNATQTLVLVRTSLIFSVCSSVLGLAFGGTLAWLVARTNMPGRAFVEVIVLVSLAFPGLIYAIAWLLLLSPRGSLSGLLNLLHFHVSSLPGMTLIESFAQIPISFLLMKAIFTARDGTMEEASQVSGVRPSRTMLGVTLPLALPGILSILILNLVRTLESFEIPTIVGLPGGVRTFVSQIYQLSTVFPPQLGQVGVYSVVLVVVLILALAINARLLRNLRRFESVKGKATSRARQSLGSYRWPVATVAILFVFIVFIVPMLMLLWVALSPYYAKLSAAGLGRLTFQNFTSVLGLSDVQSAFWHSVQYAAIAATAVVLVGALVSWVLVRTKLRMRPVLELLGNASLAVPGTVMGVTMLTFYISLPIGIYGTSWLLILAYVAAFVPYGVRYAQPALIQVADDMEDAAAISGIRWGTRFVRVVLPLIRVALIGSWLYVFMLAFRELSRSVILYSSSTNVISVELFGLWNNGNLTEVAAFSVLLMIVLMPLGIAARRLGGSNAER